MSSNQEETLRLIAGDKESKRASKYSCIEGISDTSFRNAPRTRLILC